jgi:MFS family permease
VNSILTNAETRSNFRHLYADVFWYGILAGSAIAFLAIYATRLGATGFQISLLSAGPALVNLAFSLPAGRWLEGRPLIGASFWSAVWHRFGYLAMVALPWMFADKLQIWGVVLITLLMSAPGTLLAISFNALFADVVPAELRGEVVGKRNAIMAISLTGSALLSGQLLDHLPFPGNYQLVFGLGALGAALSTYHLGCLRLSAQEIVRRAGEPTGDMARPGLMRFLRRSGSRPLLRLELLRGFFGPFFAAYLCFYTFQYLPLPLFPLVSVRVLHLTDGQISLGSGLFYGVMLLVSLRLSTISARHGHHRVLTVGAITLSLYPLFIGLARGPELYWVASLVGGGIWALTSAGLINRLMERVPEDERPAYMALHNLVLNLGILLGSLTGPVLGERLGLQQVVLLAAGLRLLAGVLLGVWG